jgi:hypothetical protein
LSLKSFLSAKDVKDAKFLIVSGWFGVVVKRRRHPEIEVVKDLSAEDAEDAEKRLGLNRCGILMSRPARTE